MWGEKVQATFEYSWKYTYAHVTNITSIRCQIGAITSQDIFAYGTDKNGRILGEKLKSCPTGSTSPTHSFIYLSIYEEAI
jgi:hypothetical protein